MENSHGPAGMQEPTLMQANLKLGQSLHAIGRVLDRADPTTSRELKRCGWRGPYAALAGPAVGRGVNAKIDSQTVWKSI